MASKCGAVITREWWEEARKLPPEQAFRVLDAILAYRFDGTEPGDELNGIERFAVGLMIADAKRMDEVTERKRRSRDSHGKVTGQSREGNGIEVEVEEEVEREVDECVSTPQPVENSEIRGIPKPVETHTREKQLAEIPDGYIDYFTNRVKAKGYKFEDPEAALLSWWAKDKDKPEWQKRQQMPSSFDTDDFFAAAVKASERRMP